ncbi:hypothetical protein DEV91_1091, partial [Phyllobacterium brassicacearum]
MPCDEPGAALAAPVGQVSGDVNKYVLHRCLVRVRVF